MWVGQRACIEEWFACHPHKHQVSEEDLEQFLSMAIKCTILAAAGPQRSRMLATLYKDERCSKLPLYPFLGKVYLERILQKAEVSAGPGWSAEVDTPRARVVSTWPSGVGPRPGAVVRAPALARTLISAHTHQREMHTGGPLCRGPGPPPAGQAARRLHRAGALSHRTQPGGSLQALQQHLCGGAGGAAGGVRGAGGAGRLTHGDGEQAAGGLAVREGHAVEGGTAHLSPGGQNQWSCAWLARWGWGVLVVSLCGCGLAPAHQCVSLCILPTDTHACAFYLLCPAGCDSSPLPTLQALIESACVLPPPTLQAVIDQVDGLIKFKAAPEPLQQWDRNISGICQGVNALIDAMVAKGLRVDA